VVRRVGLRHRKRGGEFVVGNVHADHGENRQQLERAGYLTAQFARGAPAVLGGDLNATVQSPGLRALKARGWQEESSDLAVDHVLVRDFEIEWGATRWLPGRRDFSVNGDRPLRLSDHDPVDAVISA